MSINKLIANASGSLDKKLSIIETAFNDAKSAAVQHLRADLIDIIFVDSPNSVIKELGVGGYTASPNLIYISIDPKANVKTINLQSCLLHEMHHAMRMRKEGFGNNLGEVLITEGLATLFEEKITGITPIYAKVKYSRKVEELAVKEFKNPNFSYNDWFISGNKDRGIPKWFGYSYGYKLVKTLR